MASLMFYQSSAIRLSTFKWHNYGHVVSLIILCYSSHVFKFFLFFTVTVPKSSCYYPMQLFSLFNLKKKHTVLITVFCLPFLLLFQTPHKLRATPARKQRKALADANSHSSRNAPSMLLTSTISGSTGHSTDMSESISSTCTTYSEFAVSIHQLLSVQLRDQT